MIFEVFGVEFALGARDRLDRDVVRRVRSELNHSEFKDKPKVFRILTHGLNVLNAA